MYSVDVCRKLDRKAQPAGLLFRRRRVRYEPGDCLHVEVEGVWPLACGHAELVLEAFLGGGFAGQVYRARLRSLAISAGDIPGLDVGRLYAVKILVPPSKTACRLRNLLYWLAFQGPFSAQVNRAACRAGLLWQKLFRCAAASRWGRATAVKDVYAAFFDRSLGAWGEITEWVEGRMWRLESDPDLRRRRAWRDLDPVRTASGEYVAKRQFMAGLVALMHEMGAPEFARQYTWWTMKSQPNVLKRTDVDEPGPGGGLCAIDFRAGLALLPFLPMSPADMRLILAGLFRRGRWAQFDRIDLDRLRAFVGRDPEAFSGVGPMLDELVRMDRAYRRSLPDLAGHGWRLPFDAELRRSVRAGLIEGYAAADWVDAAFAERLHVSAVRFAAFYLLGMLPGVGRILRRFWGNRAWRLHVVRQLGSRTYRRVAFRARAAAGLVEWLRAGRVGDDRAERMAERPMLFLAERFTLGLIPWPGLHRLLAEPGRVFRRVVSFFRFLHSFLTSADFREEWFLSEIEQGRSGGMLTDDEAAEIRAHVRDPFIMKYLKCLGVHFATLPLTQIVSLLVAAAAAAWMLAQGGSGARTAAVFFLVLAAFQAIPISPGSIARGLFVVYLMVRERNVRDYLVAAPLSFVKYIGYLAFPLQMTASYPRLSRFMAALWATRAVRMVPVFGERGALLEHAIFDLFYNVPQALARWFRPRAERVLSAWMGLGLGLGVWDTLRRGTVWPDLSRLNGWIAIAVLFVLPRTLFLPLLRRRRRSSAPGAGATEC